MGNTFLNTVTKLLQLFIFAAVSLSSCKKSVTPTDFIQWVDNENNGFTQKQQKNDIEVSVQYRPAAYMALVENGVIINKEQFDETEKKYSGSQYYAMRIRKVKGEGDILQSPTAGNIDYYSKLKYFSEDIRYDIYLISGRDTIPCVLNHLERTYKLSPYTNILFAFDIKKGAEQENNANDGVVFVYDDHALGLGKMTFELSTATLKKQPIIKFR